MSEQGDSRQMNFDSGLVDRLRVDARLVGRHHRGLKRWAVVFLSRGMQAVFLYRLAHALQQKKIPALPMILARVSQHVYAVDIAPSAQIGPGLVLVHAFGIVIGSATQIDGDCVVFHGVTFGDRGSEWVGTRRPDGHPVVGRGCIFGAGAKVLGPITIAENCVIGANSVVTSSIPCDSIAAGLPAKVVNQRPKMDENLRPVGGLYREEVVEAESLPENV